MPITSSMRSSSNSRSIGSTKLYVNLQILEFFSLCSVTLILFGYFSLLLLVNLGPYINLISKKAFLYGDLQKEVYMNQLPSCVVSGNEHLVCQFWKALYCLKQSPHAWFDHISVVLAYGFHCSTYDHSVFLRHSSARTIVLIVYKDGIILSGNDSTGVAYFKHYLSQQCPTKDLSNLCYFLGIDVAHSSQGFFLSQRKYVLDLLSNNDLLGA